MPPVKNKKFRHIVGIFIAGVLLSSGARGASLKGIGDRALIQVLNELVIIAESSGPMSVRVIDMVDGKFECTGASLNDCPRSKIWFAASTLGDAPKENVYQLPEAFGWKFVRWISLPSSCCDPDRYVVLEMIKSSVVKGTAQGGRAPDEKVIDTHYEIRVNPWHAYMNEIKPAKP